MYYIYLLMYKYVNMYIHVYKYICDIEVLTTAVCPLEYNIFQ